MFLTPSSTFPFKLPLLTKTLILPKFNGNYSLVLFTVGLKAVQAVEYDSATKKVYWIDGKTWSIRRSSEDDTNNEMLIGPNAEPYFYDLAIEPFSRVLFYSSLLTNSINATRLDNSSIGCVFEGRL